LVWLFRYSATSTNKISNFNKENVTFIITNYFLKNFNIRLQKVQSNDDLDKLQDTAMEKSSKIFINQIILNRFGIIYRLEMNKGKMLNSFKITRYRIPSREKLESLQKLLRRCQINH